VPAPDAPVEPDPAAPDPPDPAPEDPESVEPLELEPVPPEEEPEPLVVPLVPLVPVVDSWPDVVPPVVLCCGCFFLCCVELGVLDVSPDEPVPLDNEPGPLPDEPVLPLPVVSLDPDPDPVPPVLEDEPLGLVVDDEPLGLVLLLLVDGLSLELPVLDDEPLEPEPLLPEVPPLDCAYATPRFSAASVPARNMPSLQLILPAFPRTRFERRARTKRAHCADRHKRCTACRRTRGLAGGKEAPGGRPSGQARPHSTPAEPASSACAPIRSCRSESHRRWRSSSAWYDWSSASTSSSHS
jgi:hypothetical protein